MNAGAQQMLDSLMSGEASESSDESSTDEVTEEPFKVCSLEAVPAHGSTTPPVLVAHSIEADGSVEPVQRSESCRDERLKAAAAAMGQVSQESEESEEQAELDQLPETTHAAKALLQRNVSFGTDVSFEVGETPPKVVQQQPDDAATVGFRPALQKSKQQATDSTGVFLLKRKSIVEQAKVLQGMQRRPSLEEGHNLSVEGLPSPSLSSPAGGRRLSLEGLRSRSPSVAAGSGGRRPSVEGLRARLVSLGDDGDESQIEVQIEKGQSPRFQQQEQQVEYLQNELEEMDEQFETQEERLNVLQARTALSTAVLQFTSRTLLPPPFALSARSFTIALWSVKAAPIPMPTLYSVTAPSATSASHAPCAPFKPQNLFYAGRGRRSQR